MKIKYRPHRGLLADAMAELREFTDVKEMLEAIVRDNLNLFSITDLYISYYGYDERIGWETFVVSTARYGKEKYNYPQAIGFCTFESEGGSNG